MSARNTAALVAAIAAGPLAAQDGARLQKFQFELIGGWARSETDTTPEIEINNYALAGVYHLKPVALADHPWSEAAFLEHSSAVSAGVNYADFEIGAFSADGPLFAAGFNFADKETPIAAALNFSIGTLEGDAGVDIDLTNVNGSIGYWVRPNAILGVDVGQEEIEAGGLLEVEEFRYGIFGKIVHDLGEGRAVNAEARVGMTTVDDTISEEDNVDAGFATDFYFTRQFSVGALVEFAFGDADTEEGTTLGVRGSAWLSPQAALNVEYTTFMADSNGNDEDTLAVGFNLRF